MAHSNEELRRNLQKCELSENEDEHMLYIRESALELAFNINTFLSESREKSLAITKVEEAVLWATAGLERQ